MLLPEAPTIMDMAITTHLNKTQLQSINRVRLHRKMMHVGRDTYQNEDWPIRNCKKEELDMFSAFIRNLNPTPLQSRLPVYRDYLNPLKKPVPHQLQRGTTLTIAYDGSFDDHTMSSSISVFYENEELHFD